MVVLPILAFVAYCSWQFGGDVSDRQRGQGVSAAP
jgi:hypothetical protein